MRRFKKVVLPFAACGCLLCLVATLWPTSAQTYSPTAYASLSFFSLAALFCVAKPWRRLLLTTAVLSTLSAFISRQGNQNLPVRGPTWTQWSQTAHGNGHWYALTPSATNWLAAQQTAASWGGHLAVIRNAREQDFINTNFLIGTYEDQCLWIGLLRSASKPNLGSRLHLAMEDLGILSSKTPPASSPGSTGASAFEWVTGESLSYDNWKPGEPNNTPPGEPYVAINWAYAAGRPDALKGDWNDTPLNGTTHYGGNTDGPYFGLVERASDPNCPPTLTASQLREATWGWLLLAAMLAWISYKSRLRPSSIPATPK
jgi:hypothetical protein